MTTDILRQADSTHSVASLPSSRLGSGLLAKGSINTGRTTSTTDAKQDAALKEQQDAYFAELLSYSLERLSKEPELLQVDAEQLRRSMQEVAVSRYRAFIETAQCLALVRTEMDGVATSLDQLVDDLPGLLTTCDSFTSHAQGILEEQAANKQLYANASTLSDLLEVPHLMEACLRNGSYDEVLDLKAFIAKLGFLHGHVPVVKLLTEQADAIASSMQEQLLTKLRTHIQLPECLRVIGYLRRLAAFSEQELRLCFLRCREEWLVQLVEELSADNPYDYLKRLADLHRLHLFDVVMQFKAIFSEAQEGEDGGLLYSWAHHRIALYLDAMRAAIPRISEVSSLSSVLEHAMYCGMSLGRMGLDFRALLPPLFDAAVLAVFRRVLAVSLDRCLAALATHRWTTLGRERRAAAAPPSASFEAAAEDGAPPGSLMEHPPLAMFANGVLAAFNELRHCAALSLRAPVIATLQEALQQLTTTMVNYGATRSLEDAEHSMFAAACRVHVDVLVPYVGTCLSRVYPGSTGALDSMRLTAPLREALRVWETQRVGEMSTAAGTMMWVL